MKDQSRYPTACSFSEKDRDLFFGRDAETRELSDLVSVEPLVLLYGKSGDGKTSLLNAGVIPELKEKRKHKVIKLRFKRPNSPAENPVQQMLEQLEAYKYEGSFLPDKLDIDTELPLKETAKMWCILKNLQLTTPDVEAITLIFDHFETLFTFRELLVKAFGRSLAELLRLKPPKIVRNRISAKLKSDPGYFTGAEVDQLLEPLNLKVLISVNHDHLGSMDQLKGVLPGIFANTYKLQGMIELHAKDVLQKPAMKKGKFATPAFTYSPSAIDHIFTSLKDKKSKRIETFKLGIIGKHAENKILRKQKKNPESKKHEFTAKDLGEPKKILENYYKDITADMPRKSRKKARKLIEDLRYIENEPADLSEKRLEAIHEIPENLLNTMADKCLLQPDSISGGKLFNPSAYSLTAPIRKTVKVYRTHERIFVGGKSINRWLLLPLLIPFAYFLCRFFCPLLNGSEPPCPPCPDPQEITITLTGPIDCDTATVTIDPTPLPVIDAVDDQYPVASGSSGEIPDINVLDNDTLGGEAADPADVTLTSETTGGVTINPNGTITISEVIPDSVVEVEYTICENANPANCDKATVTITIGPTPPLDAVDDDFAVNTGSNGVLPGINALDNDTLVRLPVDAEDIVLTSETTGGVTINPDGTITIAEGTPDGVVVLEYTICEVADPESCDTATVTITIRPPTPPIVKPHLIAIYKSPLIPRSYDANPKDVLYIMRIEDKEYKFWGFTKGGENFRSSRTPNNKDSLNLDSLLSSKDEELEIKYSQFKAVESDGDKKISFQRCREGRDAGSDRIQFVKWAPSNEEILNQEQDQYISDQRYIDNEDTIRATKDEEDAYADFVNKLKKASKEDCIYFTELEWSELDKESKKKFTETLNRLKAGSQ